MSKGAQILLCWGAANRDPVAFENADQFDIDRAGIRKHQSFGYGIHACAGAVIARQELTESYCLLLERLHNIRLADGLSLADLKRRGGAVTHGLERLPIQFDVARR
jgi:cytochrome P450